MFVDRNFSFFFSVGLVSDMEWLRDVDGVSRMLFHVQKELDLRETSQKKTWHSVGRVLDVSTNELETINSFCYPADNVESSSRHLSRVTEKISLELFAIGHGSFIKRTQFDRHKPMTLRLADRYRLWSNHTRLSEKSSLGHFRYVMHCYISGHARVTSLKY